MGPIARDRGVPISQTSRQQDRCDVALLQAWRASRSEVSLLTRLAGSDVDEGLAVSIQHLEAARVRVRSLLPVQDS
jgi:hypothetical protein